MDLNRIVLWSYLSVMCVTNGQAKLAMTFDTVKYEYNTAYVSYLNVSVIQPNKTSLNAALHTLYNFCDDTAVIIASVPQSQKQSPIDIMNVKCKVGDFLKGTGNNLFKLIHEAMSKHSNIPKKCPIAPNFVWYFNNYMFNIEKIPLVLTRFNFILHLRVLRPNAEQVLYGNLTGRVECKGVGCPTGFKRG